MTPAPYSPLTCPAAEDAAMAELYELPITVAARMTDAMERNRHRSDRADESPRRTAIENRLVELVAMLDDASRGKFGEWIEFCSVFNVLADAMHAFVQDDADMLAMYRRMLVRRAETLAGTEGINA